MKKLIFLLVLIALPFQVNAQSAPGFVIGGVDMETNEFMLGVGGNIGIAQSFAPDSTLTSQMFSRIGIMYQNDESGEVEAASVWFIRSAPVFRSLWLGIGAGYVTIPMDGENEEWTGIKGELSLKATNSITLVTGVDYFRKDNADNAIYPYFGVGIAP